MCVIEYVDHHSAFTTTNAIIPRIISSSSSALAARAHVRTNKHTWENKQKSVCVSEWIQVNMIDIATSFGATDATFWKTNF